MSGFLTSSVGKKYVMGLTALIWVGFIFSHMAGNLLIFVSPAAYNSYGHAIVTNKLLPVAEAGLVLALVVHVYLAISLTMGNRKARPNRYAASGSREKGASLASRTMALHGTVILVFVIMHLATFKYGTYYTTTVDGVEMRDLYRLMSEVFAQPGYVVWYVIALLFLFAHVTHGFASVFQSFGLLHPSYQGLIKKLSWVYGIVVIGGFLSQPIAIYLFPAKGG